MDLPNRLLPVLIAVVAVLTPANRRGQVLAGGIISTLALASLQIAGGPKWLDAGLAPEYLSITAALLSLGVILAVLGGLLPVKEPVVDSWPRARKNAALVVIALGGYALTLLAKAAGPLRSAGALAGLLAVLAGIWLVVRYAGLSRWVARRRAAHSERFPPLPVRRLEPVDLGLIAAQVIFAVLALLGPHLLLLLGRVVGSAATGLLLARRAGITRRPWEMLVALAVLLLVSSALMLIAGDTSLRLSELEFGPFSPAFEPIGALGLLLAAWPLFRLWPFQHAELGPLTPLAGAALVVRVAAPVLPAGSAHWLPLLFPLLVLATWYSIFSGDWTQALRALAFAGLASLHPTGVQGGGVLLAGECLVALAVLAAPERARTVIGGTVTLVAMWQLLPLLNGSLQAQTFYTVLLSVSVALSLVLSAPCVQCRPAR